MGIDVKDVEFVVKKVLVASSIYCYGLVQKYPLVSGALLFSSILYIYFPTIFKIIICASPVIACFVVYFRFYLASNHPKEKHVIENKQRKHTIAPKEPRTEDSGPTEDVLIVVNRGNHSFVLRQTSRRRLIKEKNKAWDAEGFTDEKDHVSLEDDKEDLTACTNLIEESTEETEAEKNSCDVPDCDEVEGQTENTSLVNFGPPEGVTDFEKQKPDIVLNDGYAEEIENTSPATGEINSRNLEEIRGDGNKDVELTDKERRYLTDSAASMPGLVIPDVLTRKPFDTNAIVNKVDAKSLKEVPGDGKRITNLTDGNQEDVMDLGESEQERNKRLERLISKRNARRLFRLAVEKNLNDTKRSPSEQFAPIHVSKINQFEFPGNSDDSSIPGSAPSVLLPAHNPFDLPYDPSEEKPNLTEDSFQQEYMVPQQKEMFCRHESFSLGPSFPLDSNHDQQSSKFGRFDKRVDRLGFSRFRGGSGEQDELAQLLIQEHDPVSFINTANDQGGRIPTIGKTESTENRHVHNSIWDAKENETESTHDEGSKDNESEDHVKAENTSQLSSSSSEEVEGSAQGSRSQDHVETDLTEENTNRLTTSSSEEDEDFTQGNISQYQVETDLTDRNNSFSSSEEDEEFYSDRRAILSSSIKVPNDFSDAVRKSLAWSMPNKTVGRPPAYDSSLSNDKRIMEGTLYYEERGFCHTPSYSIASDLVVEVSEVSSPPSTIDESHPNSDEELSSYGEFLERENNYGSQGNLTAASSCHRETKVGNHMGTAKLELSGIKKDWEESMTFFTPREQLCKQDLADTDAFSSSRDDFIRNIHDKVKQVVEQSLTKAHQLPEKSGGHKPQELSNPSKNISTLVLHTNDNTEDFRDNETVEALRVQEDTAGSSKLSEKIYFDSSNISDKSVKLNYTSNSTNTVKGDSQMPSIHNVIADTTGSFATRDDFVVTEDDMNERSSNQEQLSSVQQHLDGPDVSVMQPQMVAEQASDHSSSSSPKSVLQNKVAADDGSHGTSDQHMDTEVPEYDADNLVENRLLEERLFDELSPSIAEILPSIVEDQMINPFADGDFANSKDVTISHPDLSMEPTSVHNTNTQPDLNGKEANGTFDWSYDQRGSGHSRNLTKPESIIGPAEILESANQSRESMTVSNVEFAESSEDNADKSRNSLYIEVVAQPPKPPEQPDDLFQQKSVLELDTINNDGRQHIYPVISTEENSESSRTSESRSSQDITETDLSLEETSEVRDCNTENKGVVGLLDTARVGDSSTNINEREERLTNYENLGDLLQPIKGKTNAAADEILRTEPNDSVPDISNCETFNVHHVVVEPLVSAEAEENIIHDNVTEPRDLMGRSDNNLDSVGKNKDTSGIPEERVNTTELPRWPESSNSHFTGLTGDEFSKTVDDEATVGPSMPETEEEN